jgi:hypothetical protein
MNQVWKVALNNNVQYHESVDTINVNKLLGIVWNCIVRKGQLFGIISTLLGEIKKSYQNLYWRV